MFSFYLLLLFVFGAVLFFHGFIIITFSTRMTMTKNLKVVKDGLWKKTKNYVPLSLLSVPKVGDAFQRSIFTT